MNSKKILFLNILTLLMVGCNQNTNVLPTKMYSTKESIDLFLNTTRDLNDIITLKFEPTNTSIRTVSWETNEKDIFTLDGSNITTLKVGEGIVTAKSTFDTSLKVDILINVIDPYSTKHSVNINESDDFKVLNLNKEYEEGKEVTFIIDILKENKDIDIVTINNNILKPIKYLNYKFIMPDEDAYIKITLKDKIHATSVILSEENIEMKVGDPDYKLLATVLPINTSDEPTWSIIEGNDIISIKPNSNEVEIHAIKKGNAKVKVYYNEDVFAIATINVLENDITKGYELVSKYNINYDLGTRKTAKLLDTLSDVLNTFSFVSGENIINTISEANYIYGGGNGGRSETQWYEGNMLKFGTTSINGDLTINLNKDINAIKIEGYTSLTTSKIRVGDSTSLDWNETGNDNKTTLVTLDNMNEVDKETVEAHNVSSIIIDFTSTNTLKIASTNKKPFYITSIEFLNK